MIRNNTDHVMIMGGAAAKKQEEEPIGRIEQVSVQIRGHQALFNLMKEAGYLDKEIERLSQVKIVGIGPHDVISIRYEVNK